MTDLERKSDMPSMLGAHLHRRVEASYRWKLGVSMPIDTVDNIIFHQLHY